MDKNKIKALLSSRFVNEDKTPGISVTDSAKKESDKINKAAIKAVAKDVDNYDKGMKKEAGKTKMAPNKFNYNGDKEKEYHDQMEIMNGQEMIQYDREPDADFKARAREAIAGSSRMGNEGGIGNAEATWGASSDTFGEDLVKGIEASQKKRADADRAYLSLGDDIELLPPSEKGKGKNYALKEGDEQDSKSVETGYGSEEENEFNNQQRTAKPQKSEDPFMFGASDRYKKDMEGRQYGTGSKRNPNPDGDGISGADFQRENKQNNNKPKIKEGMKRLKFKKEFNGVGNALKLIPEAYRVANKEFEMTDGNESYKIRWEGTLSEGRAVVLTATDKNMVTEDITNMKRLFNYKSQDTLGLVRGNARLNENAAFSDVLAKTKKLLGESEDIEDETAAEGEWDGIEKSAPEAKKHIEGSVSTDKGTQAPAPKKGEWDGIEKSAPEATKHVDGSVDAKIGMGLGVKAKEGAWDKISVPQAADAKKHVTMGEGLTLNGITFKPMVETVKKKVK